jgi:hypothetical protein
MRIGFLWHVSFPWDVRLERMMRVCIDHGHSVSLLCKGKAGLPENETLDGVRIHLIGASAARPSRVQRLLAYPLFFNPTDPFYAPRYGA